MKILIVNSYDTFGGAARAAYRLFLGLKTYGINVEMLVQKKFSNNDDVVEFKSTSQNYDTILCRNYPNKSQTLFSSSIKDNPRLVEYINISDADIVHMHWIVNSFISIGDLARIKKPIAWTLHDMWAFTGGCHYDEECEFYKNKCNSCIVLNSMNKNDLSTINFNRKLEAYRSIENLSIIGVSKWMGDCAKQSSLLKNYKIYNLPNPIDTNIFKPYNKIKAKQELSIKANKKIILFGAMSAMDDPRKGYGYLQEALGLLNKDEYIFLIFGKSSLVDNSNTIYLDHIEDDEKLSKIYSCADVMVVPSLQENLSNTIMESLSCGTPVVAFDIGGNSDMIDHRQNGYLVKAFDTADLARGMEWVLENSSNKQLSEYARKKVLDNFSYDVVVSKYIELYRKIVKDHNPQIQSDRRVEASLISLLTDALEIHNEQNISKNFSKQFNTIYRQLHLLNGNIVIYGNGTVGKTIRALIPDKIVGYVDMMDQDNHPRKLLEMEYDKILISVLGREDDIVKYLTQDLGIKEEKIVTLRL